MDSIPKFLASIITIIIGVLLCVSFIISSVVVNSARTYHASVIEEIEASAFDEVVIEKCKVAAERDHYLLEIDNVESMESGSKGFYKVTLYYNLAAPIFGQIHTGKLVGYALAGAQISGDSVPGLYESGSGYDLDKLLISWDELLRSGAVSVTDGALKSGYDVETSSNSSSAVLDGDLLLPFDGSITEISDLGFYNCTLLTGVKVPDSVIKIGQQAFSSCWDLSTIELGNGIQQIGYGAFENDSAISTVIYDGGLKDWSRIVFDFGESNPVYYGAKLQLNDEELVHLTLPVDGPASLENKFIGCGSLFSVTIPDHVSGISQLTDVSDYAFARCYSLITASIGSGVTRIGQYAFLDCNLNSITIPDTVTEIDSYAFSSCDGLTDIYYEGTKEQWGAISFGTAWDSETGAYTVHCSDGNLAKS